MSEQLAALSFLDLYLRLDAPEPPSLRVLDKNKRPLHQPLPESLFPQAERFAEAIRAKLHEREDGTIDFEGLRCRLSKQRMADGSVWACARRIAPDAPKLEKLGFAPHIRDHLRSLGRRDGLILISAAAGHGKTTTSIGLLLDYLRSFGGTGIAVERPAEYVVKGPHGLEGYCFQTEVLSDEDWASAIERALSWDPRYLYVSEVRTPKAAEQILHAASTGRTVIAAVHGGAPEESLLNVLSLAERAMGAGAARLMAGCLTALVHQTLKADGPFVRYLFTEEDTPSDPIRALIREGKIGMLSTYIDRLAARLSGLPSPLPVD